MLRSRVRTAAQLERIKKIGKCSVRMGIASGALRHSAQAAATGYLLLHGRDCEAAPGLFSIKSPLLGYKYVRLMI